MFFKYMIKELVLIGFMFSIYVFSNGLRVNFLTKKGTKKNKYKYIGKYLYLMFRLSYVNGLC